MDNVTEAVVIPTCHNSEYDVFNRMCSMYIDKNINFLFWPFEIYVNSLYQV